MSIVIHTHKHFNGTAGATAVTLDVSSDNAADWAFGNMGLHWDVAHISNVGSDPIRVTFDDFSNARIDDGEGFVVPGNGSIVLRIHYSWSISVIRHSGSGSPSYSILCTTGNGSW